MANMAYADHDPLWSSIRDEVEKLTNQFAQ